MYKLSAVEGTQSMTPSARLLAALGLEPHRSAQVEDLYSRPIVRIEIGSLTPAVADVAPIRAAA